MPLREFIAKQGGLVEINLVGENIFAGVVVNSVIFSIKKCGNNELLRVIHNGIEQYIKTSNWASHPSKTIEYRITDQAQSILEKIENNSSKFSDFGDVIQGITPYDKYRGQSLEII